VKTVLFAWELGAGTGHLMTLRRLASYLQPYGVKAIAGICRSAPDVALDEFFSEIHHLPSWSDTSGNRERRAASSATMNDILAGAGLASATTMRGMLEAWDRVFRATKPDLVIAEYAPAAVLAAQRRIPLMLVGTGFTLPPQDMPRFPLLHRLAPPVFSERQTLEAVNEAKGFFKWPLLDRLPQVFAGDAYFVRTFPLLDPYRYERNASADGPILDRMPTARKSDAETIFVYISRGVAPHRHLAGALRPAAERVHIYAPMLSADECSDLEARGATIALEPVALADALSDCSLVIHLGGNGLAAEAIAAGVPQLVLSTHVEQELNGLALEDAGVGRMIRAHDPASSVSFDMIEWLLTNDALARRAAELGDAARAVLEQSWPRTRFVDLSLRTIG
jgi:UDP:flavonoid glycosyltransferase YjiC (YdhE family)